MRPRPGETTQDTSITASNGGNTTVYFAVLVLAPLSTAKYQTHYMYSSFQLFITLIDKIIVLSLQ